MLQKTLLTFVRLALQPKVPISATFSQIYFANKCYHFKHAPKFKMQMPDILLLTRIGSLPKKKRKKATKTTIFVMLGNHDSLHFPIIPLTPSATTTIILDSPKDSPRFGQKRKFTIHCYYSPVTIHPSLFTGTIHRYCSLRNFAYLRGAVPYI